MGDSQLVERELRSLKKRIGYAIQMHKELLKIMGSLDLILSVSSRT